MEDVVAQDIGLLLALSCDSIVSVEDPENFMKRRNAKGGTAFSIKDCGLVLDLRLDGELRLG